MKPSNIRVLLIDDSEEDALFTRHMLAHGKTATFTIAWAPSYAAGLQHLTHESCDVALIDFRLDERNGIDLLREAVAAGCNVPMIILTGLGDEHVDTEAMQAGAADYLIKGKDDADMLQRVIRHALERHRSQAALAAERQRLQTLIDTLPDFIYFKDASSRFIINNAAHLHILGAQHQAEVTGRTDFDFLPPDVARQYLADEQHIIDAGEALINKEETLVTPDGRRQWLLTTKVPLRAPDGGVTGIVGMSRDITDVKEAQEQLRRAHDELERRVIERTAALSEAVNAQRREIAQREQAEDKLREAEERYRLIFEQILDAIVLVDIETGRFVDFNEPAHRQLGYTRDEFARIGIAEIEVAETPEAVGQHIHRIVAQGTDVFETRHRTKSGEIRHVSVSTRIISLRGRQVVLALFHDFTERRRMEDELREAIVHLEKHDKAKSEFVSNVSHELKTPLTSMLYGTHNLLKGISGPLPDEAVRYLSMFHSECQRMVTTINDILDLGKLDNRTLVLSPVTMPLARLITQSAQSIRIQADAVGTTLQVEVDRQAGFVRCDPSMMQRVLQNLLANAIKFTPDRGAIRVQGTVSDGDPGMARIIVSDNGIGIPPEAIGRVTERYYRAANHPSGSGLGLAISREIVTLHGGRLALTSPVPGSDCGTQVTVTLPAATPPVVLIACADPAVSGIIAEQLAHGGYGIKRAVGGSDALHMAEHGGIDVIVLDLATRDGLGCDVILTLKSSAAMRYIPIVVITGAAVDETRLDVLTQFAVPSLPKPWKPEELQEAIEGALVGITAFHGIKTHREKRP
jgi:PAS domain S-box-containing protein